MIPAAPVDLWDRVIEKIAKLVFERETNLERGTYGVKMPHLAQVEQKPAADKAS